MERIVRSSDEQCQCAGGGGVRAPVRPPLYLLKLRLEVVLGRFAHLSDVVVSHAAVSARSRKLVWSRGILCEDV